MNGNSRRGLKFFCALLAPFAIFSEIDIFAVDRTFTLGGTTLTLEDVTTNVNVYYTSMRFNRALNVWNVEASLSNHTAHVLSGPFVLSVESFTGTSGPMQTDGTAVGIPASPFFDLSGFVADGQLAPSELSLKRTLTLGFQPGGSPSLTTKIFAAKTTSAEALALVATLDEVGQPLPGVNVLVIGPDGQGTNQTDAAFGVATLGKGAGINTFQFHAPGYLSVWRRQSLDTNGVGIIPSPRLTKRDTNVVVLTPIAGGQLSNSAVQITIPPGAVSSNTSATLTPLTGQTLPAFLPLGWSPLQAFSLDLDGEPSLPPTVQMRPLGPFNNGETGAFVRWNTNTFQWDVLQTITSTGTNAITAPLAGSGAFVLVVGDSAPLNPPPPQSGQPLLPSTASLPNPTNLVAGGTVEPDTSPASRVPELVTATAQVIITNLSGNLPSGVLFRSDVNEQYHLRDGTLRVTPQYENFLVGYQRPGDGQLDTLHATFPMRPLLLFGADELDNALVHVDVLNTEAFTGGVLHTNSGQLISGDLRLLTGEGDLLDTQAGQLRSLSTTNFAGLVTSNLTLLRAFDLSIGGIAPGGHLALQVQGLPTNALFVVARVLSDGGVYGLEPRERLASDSLGRLLTLETNATDHLPGINSAGEYLLLQMSQPQALVKGVARNSQNLPAGGLAVRLAPWLTRSRDPDGLFLLLAPTGTATVAVTDLQTGDTGQVDLSVPNPGAVLTPTLATVLTGPRVISLSPTNNATAVSRVTPVVVTFNKPINAGSLVPNGIVLLDASNQPVTASVSLNLSGTTVTLLPVNPLAPSTHHTLVLSTNLADLSGRKLEGPNAFAFTTESDSLNRVGGQFIIYEPTNGFAPVFGTAGTADPESPVILVNETSGETATILSGVDGSFSNSISASVDDFLSAVLVNQNGTRTIISATRQIFQDGRVGLFKAGGTIELATTNGPIQVSVEPGAIASKTILKLDPVSAVELNTALGGQQPEGGLTLGAFRFTETGDPLQFGADVSFPITPASLPLQPGESPTNRGFALCQPITQDGVTGFEIVDRMHFENGRLVTHSPPFPGLGATAAGTFLSLPIMMAFGTTLAIAGEVATVSEAAGPVSDAAIRAGGIATNGTVYPITPLVGAIVGASPQGNLIDISSPVLRPGAVVARANKNGFYALLFPVDSLNPDVIAIRATHPRFPGISGTTPAQPAPASDFQAGLVANVVLRLPGSGNFSDQIPPILTVTTPGNLQLNSPQTVQFNLRDDVSLPALDSATIDFTASTALFANRALFAGEANISVGAVSNTSPQSITIPVTFNVTTGAVVAVQAVVRDQSGNVATNRLNFRFGVGPPAGTNALAAADPNDLTGPEVVSINPQKDGIIGNGQMIIRFNEPVDKGIEGNDAAITISPGVSMVRQLSANQQELLVTFSGLQPDQKYDVILQSGQVMDLAHNVMSSSVQTSFHTPAAGVVALDGIQNAVATAAHNGFNFTLDQLQAGGFLVSHVIGASLTPQKIGSLSLPPFPRTMELVPNYAFKLTTNGPVRTNTLIVATGGLVGDGNVGEWVWVIDVTDPTNMVRIASELGTVDFASTLSAIKWSPPRLAVLETRSEGSVVHHVNLQAFILGANGSTTVTYFPGVDANGDGDFVDTGDQLPIPERLTFFGDEFTTIMEDNRLLSDIAIDGGGAFEVGIVASRGAQPTFFQVLTWQGAPISNPGTTTEGRVNFPFGTDNAQARRVELDLSFPITDTNGTHLIPAAIVALDNELRIFDLSDPVVPTPVRTNLLGPGSQNIFSITRVNDDEYAVGTPGGTFILSRFLMGSTNGLNGAIADSFSGLPMQGRAFSANNVVLGAAYGGVARVLVRPPEIKAVRVFSLPVLSGSALVATNHDTKLKFVHDAVESEFLVPAPLARCDNSSSEYSTNGTPNPLFNHYPLVIANGNFGADIFVTVESLDIGLRLQTPKGADFPAIILTRNLASLGFGAQHPGSSAMHLRRLSDDPNDELFDYYVASPFVVVLEPLTSDQQKTLTNSVAERQVIWGGDYARLSFDLAPNGNAVLEQYSGTISSSQYLPGLSRSYRSFRGEYLDSPNPSFPRGVPRVAGVDMQGGEFRQNETDMFIEGRLQPLAFTRIYESRSRYVGPFGRGWDFNYNARLHELPDTDFPDGYTMGLLDRGDRCDAAQNGDVLFIDGAGSVLVFRFIRPGNTNLSLYATDPAINQFLGPNGTTKIARYYESPPGIFSVLYKLTDEKFMLVMQNGARLHFLPDGRLDRTVGVFSQSVVQCRYNADGSLQEVEGDRGVKIEFGYYKRFPSSDFGLNDVQSSDPVKLGKIAKLHASPITANASEVVYDYDATGNLWTIKPALDAKTVLVWSQQNPHELASIGRGDGTEAPAEGITYVDGMVTSVSQNGSGTSEPLVFAGAKATSRERFKTGPSTVAVTRGGSPMATINVDERGRPTEFANRPYEVDDQDRPMHIANPFTESRLHYDDSNTVYRFRGNLLSTEQAPPGATGKFISGVKYDGSAWNRILANTNVDGVTTLYDYSPAGDLTAPGVILETTGPVTHRYPHNEFGQPQSEITSDTAVSATPPFERDFGYAIGLLSPDGGLRTSESAPGLNGSTTSRDTFGRIQNVNEAGAGYLTIYFDDGQPHTMTDASGAAPNVTYSYDGNRIQTETISAGAKSVANTYTYDTQFPSRVHQLIRQETGLPTSTTTYNYNSQSQLKDYTVDGEQSTVANNGLFPSGMSGAGRARSLVYNGPPGSPTAVTEQGLTATLTYDAAARVDTITQQGLTTKLIYDDNGGVLRNRARRKEFTASGNSTVLASEDLTFDTAGRVQTTTSKNSRVRSYEYFADGDVRQMSINGTLVLDKTRNVAGLLTQSRLNEFQYDYSSFDTGFGLPQTETLTLQPSFRAVTRQKAYDNAGHVKTITLPAPAGIYSFGYDGFGNPTTHSDPDGVLVTEDYSPGGLLLSTTFGDGATVTYKYTAQRHLDFVSGAAGLMDYDYDSDGLVKTITYPDGATTEFQNRNAFFEADVVKYGSLSQNHTWTNGRLAAINVPATGDNLSYAFDAFGRRATVLLNGVKVSFGYNDDGELTAQTNTLDNVPRAWSVSFDPLNHALSEAYPSGLTLAFAPNTFGHPTSMSAVGISGLDWIGGGLVERVTYSGGLKVTREYDTALRVDKITYHTGAQPTLGVVAGFEYDLTTGGRILTERRVHEGRQDVFGRNLPTQGMRIKDFFFSATNSAGAGAQDGVTGFSFSGFGEIQSPAATFGADPRSIHAAVTETAGRVITADGQPVNYNDQGSVTNAPVWVYLPGQSTVTRVQAGFEYDGLGMVRAVHRADGVDVTYTRDGLGRIVRKIVTGPVALARTGTNDYFWAADRLLEERENGTGGFKFRRYVYAGRYLVLVQTAASEAGPFQDFVPLLTVNGSIGGYATPAGTLVETIRYGAYGTPVFSAGSGDPGSSTASTLLFQGAFYDDASGLYQFGQRNLHPQLGRFLQRDNELFTESLAMFTAFNGDPAGRVDPAGEFSESELSHPYKLYKDTQAKVENFGKSADAFFGALEDSRADRSRKSTGLGAASVDLATSALKLSGTFGDDNYRTLVNQTVGQLDQIKTGLGILQKIPDWSNDREMLSAIKSVASSKPVPGFFTLRQTLQSGGTWSTASVGELERRFGSDKNFKRAKFYDINKEGRRGIVKDAKKDYLNSREGHLLAIGQGVQKLGDAYLQNALKDDKSQSASVARQLSKTSGALLNFADKLRSVSASAEIGAMRKTVSNVGLLEELQAPNAISALQVSYTVGFEAGKLGVIFFNDPDVAEAYQEQVQKFSDNGGWLTVGSGVLSTVGRGRHRAAHPGNLRREGEFCPVAQRRV